MKMIINFIMECIILKRFIPFLLIATTLLTACTPQKPQDDGKIDIVCTVFPVYDWTRQIIGDSNNTNLTYLLANGSDLHNFQPTADDIIKISSCDVFVYVGGESDAWIDDILANAQNKSMKVINLLDVLANDVVEEEVKEGMHSENNSNESEYDEHIWLSLENAEKCVSAIYNNICSVNSENYALYTTNTETYIDNLAKLDEQFHELFDDNTQTLIFGDRFPFRYFVDDYNLNYYAAFTGCSADTDASFDTITFLAEKVDELNADTVFAIENSDCTIADSVIENTKSKSQNIAVLDSAQSVTSQQIADGLTYLSIMQKNYNILQEVFQ